MFVVFFFFFLFFFIFFFNDTATTEIYTLSLHDALPIFKTLKTWLWVFSAIDNLRNVKLHHIDDDPNMSLWDDFRQNRRPKVLSEKIAIFTRRGPGNTCKTLKTLLWVFSATDNLRNVRLHHIAYGPNMSLWVDFRQNRRPKVLSEKKSDFHQARTCREFQNPRNMIMGFLSKRQPEESETSPHRLRPQYESVRRFQSN